MELVHVLLSLYGLVIWGALARLDRKQRRIEYQLDALLSAIGVPAADVQVSDRVHELVVSGKRIQAIRAVREEQGIGLSESVDVVDRLEMILPVGRR